MGTVLAEVMVSVGWMPRAVGTSDAGENAHVMPAGCPVQARVVEVLKVLSAVSVRWIVVVLDRPGGGCGMVTAPLLRSSVKSLILTVKLAECDCPKLVPV